MSSDRDVRNKGAGEAHGAYPTSVFVRPNGAIFDIRVGVKPPGDTTDRFEADLP